MVQGTEPTFNPTGIRLIQMQMGTQLNMKVTRSAPFTFNLRPYFIYKWLFEGTELRTNDWFLVKCPCNHRDLDTTDNAAHPTSDANRHWGGYIHYPRSLYLHGYHHGDVNL